MYILDRHKILGSIPPFSTKPELIMTSEYKFSNYLACKLPIYNFSYFSGAKKGPKSKFLAHVGQILICQVILHSIMHILGLSYFWRNFFVKIPPCGLNVIVAPEANPSLACYFIGLTFSCSSKVPHGFQPRQTLHRYDILLGLI